MTTAVASISVTFEPDDNWTVIAVRRQDDLPAYIKSSSLGRGAVWSTEPQNKPPSYKCSISGTLQTVEFINDAWYLLAYSALYGAYRTRARDHAPRQNRYRLGWWTDEELVQQSLPPPLPPTIPEPPQLVSHNPAGHTEYHKNPPVKRSPNKGLKKTQNLTWTVTTQPTHRIQPILSLKSLYHSHNQ